MSAKTGSVDPIETGGPECGIFRARAGGSNKLGERLAIVWGTLVGSVMSVMIPREC